MVAMIITPDIRTTTKRAMPFAFVVAFLFTRRPVITTRTPLTGLPASRTRTRTIVFRPTVKVRGVTVSA